MLVYLEASVLRLQDNLIGDVDKEIRVCVVDVLVGEIVGFKPRFLVFFL